MAAVYAATHRNGKRVALKMLHTELSTNTEVRQRFVDEGYAANRVGHPGAVSVIDDDVAEDGSAFLVMDLLEGETLETRLQRRGKIWPGELLPIIDALLDVLASAHDRGIVHRDIKPDNIFMTREGEVKLLDFGIARMIEPGRPRTTQSGATMGTPAFMPPEQARGRWDQLDGRTDLWAVGATMFIQLTGRQVHQAETPNEELLLAMTTPAPSLGEVGPHLPKPLIEVVDRALAFEQDDRWPNARAMRAAIRTVQALLGPEALWPIGVNEIQTIPPSDTAAPVTLLTPHPSFSSAFASRLARRRKLVVAVTGAAAAFAALALMTQALRRRADADSPGAASPAVREPRSIEVTAVLAPSAPPLAVPERDTPPASRESSPAATVRPKTEKGRVRKPMPRGPQEPKSAGGSPSTTASSASSGAPGGVAPPGPSPLPSNADPLDRRR
jgi:serine/threonine protein kinase